MNIAETKVTKYIESSQTDANISPETASKNIKKKAKIYKKQSSIIQKHELVENITPTFSQKSLESLDQEQKTILEKSNIYHDIQKCSNPSRAYIFIRPLIIGIVIWFLIQLSINYYGRHLAYEFTKDIKDISDVNTKDRILLLIFINLWYTYFYALFAGQQIESIIMPKELIRRLLNIGMFILLIVSQIIYIFILDKFQQPMNCVPCTFAFIFIIYFILL